MIILWGVASTIATLTLVKRVEKRGFSMGEKLRSVSRSGGWRFYAQNDSGVRLRTASPKSKSTLEFPLHGINIHLIEAILEIVWDVSIISRFGKPEPISHP
jgi:hypothetical protein